MHTTDIVLAAALKVHGYKLLNIEKTGHLGEFFFADVSAEDLKKFDLGELLVDPVQFNNTIKALTTACRRI